MNEEQNKEEECKALEEKELFFSEGVGVGQAQRKQSSITEEIDTLL